MPLEFAKDNVPVVCVCVPAIIAAMPAAGPGFTVAVTTPAVFMPNVTPFEFENTTVPELAKFVPAEIATPVDPVPPPTAPDRTSEPLENPTDKPPAPCTDIERASNVPEEPCVVFPIAYAPSV